MRKYKLERDGISEALMQSFPMKTIKIGPNQFVLYIPSAIRDYLNLKEGELIEIGLRRINKKECIKEYGFYPSKLKYDNINVVECPKCGKEGRIVISGKHGKINARITHANPKKYCYLGSLQKISLLYPKITKTIRKMLKIKNLQFSEVSL